MNEAARTTSIVLYALAIVALALAMVFPLQTGTGAGPGGTVDVAARAFALEATTTAGNSSVLEDGSWYDDGFETYGTAGDETAPGITMLRVGAPMLAAGAVLAVVALILVAVRRRLLSGIGGALATVLAGLGLGILLIGLNDFLEASLVPAGLDMQYALGFWGATVGLLACAAAAAFAFVAVAEGEGGPARANLPARPAISVEDPYAFNPLASQEARPFKADPPQELRGFEVTGGNRPFRMDDKKGGQPPST